MTASPKSPLAPKSFPNLLPIAGLEMGAIAAGLRYQGRLDLMLAVMHRDTVAAGVFTKSRCPSAPVDWCRASLKDTGGKYVRALVVNAGNANAFTGSAGLHAARATAEATAAVVGCEPEQIMLASTGVIGEPLNAAPIVDGIAQINAALSGAKWQDGADAILTTDTFAKSACEMAEIDGEPVAISGIAKGSGMIAPDMATMLAFIFTNANLSPNVLQSLLQEATELTFNCITVDSDTSTSDTVLAFATGQNVRHPQITDPNDPRLDDFRAKFITVNRNLAHQVVRDGEGASKFVSVTIEGAENDLAAKKIALSVANSPLVKTAIAGEDANWGRIIMAIGKAGELAERDLISIWIGETLIAVDGAACPNYDEMPVQGHMRGNEIDIRAYVGIAKGRATVWTCDLTHGYISINGDYRS